VRRKRRAKPRSLSRGTRRPSASTRGINALIFKGAAIEQGFGTYSRIGSRSARRSVSAGRPGFRTLVEAGRREAERILSTILTLKIEDHVSNSLFDQ
jgi:hypothetical protein